MFCESRTVQGKQGLQQQNKQTEAAKTRPQKQQ
jgi:hypothetical protein